MRSGAALCPICHNLLELHDSYRRHCRDESGKRHYGWVAQGHCATCDKYPALIPDFIKPYKHYKADVIERAISETEAGNNVEDLGGCAADASTMRRWVREFKARGEQAVDSLFSKLPTVHSEHIGSHNLQDMTLLQQLARLLCEYPVSESSGVIGATNIILTTQNCGFL